MDPSVSSTPIPPGAKVIRLKPDGGQMTLIRILENPANKEVYVIGSRRRGKSWSIAVCVGKFGLDNPTSPADKGQDRPRKTAIAIVAPDYERTRPIYNELKNLFPEAITKHDDNAMLLTLRGGATIKCWSGENMDSIRGQGYDLVVLDEAAFLNEALVEAAVMPTMLDRDGRLWALSTPKFGKKNWWCARWLAAHEAETAGEPIPGVIAYHLGTSFDNPRIDPENLKRQLARRDPLTVREEYMGEILDNSSNWLDRTKLIPIKKEDIPANTFNVIIVDSAWARVKSGQVDKTSRRRKDATVIAVIGQDTQGNAYLIDGTWSQTMQPHEAFELIDAYARNYNAKRLGKEQVADDAFFQHWNDYCRSHAGVPTIGQVPFHRGSNWKSPAIRYWSSELLYAKRMFVSTACQIWPHLMDEMDNYNEVDAASDRCHDDCLTVMSDILQPGIWIGNRAMVLKKNPKKDIFFLEDAWKMAPGSGVTRLRSKYSTI